MGTSAIFACVRGVATAIITVLSSPVWDAPALDYVEIDQVSAMSADARGVEDCLSMTVLQEVRRPRVERGDASPPLAALEECVRHASRRM